MGLSTSPAAEQPRTVPNLPAALVRRLAARLGVNSTSAMRIALLYGDIEWQAAGASQLRYSARDYGRRVGLHPHTVQADLRRLIALEAITAAYDSGGVATLQLQGLYEALERPEAVMAPADRAADPAGSGEHPPTGSTQHPAPGDGSDQGWVLAPPTKEKGSKPREKSSETTAAPEADQQNPAQSPTQTPAQSQSQALVLLHEELLEAFRSHRPHDWPAPTRLTLTSGRLRKLRQGLAHAGSQERLLQHLRQALAQVPPWFRSTYPQRPDGSRRPAHQFIDLLFRAGASERECGPEAWPLFAWSEAHGSTPANEPGPVASNGEAPPPEPDLQRARRWFAWASGLWSIQDIAALRVSAAERRRLTALLEASGCGIPGTGAQQFADPAPEQGAASAVATTSALRRHRPAGRCGRGPTAARCQKEPPVPHRPSPAPHPADG